MKLFTVYVLFYDHSCVFLFLFFILQKSSSEIIHCTYDLNGSWHEWKIQNIYSSIRSSMWSLFTNGYTSIYIHRNWLDIQRESKGVTALLQSKILYGWLTLTKVKGIKQGTQKVQCAWIGLKSNACLTNHPKTWLRVMWRLP